MAPPFRFLTTIPSLLIFLNPSWAGVVNAPRHASCRCLAGEYCWPSSQDWDHLNKTTGGNLIATVPLGSPCHDPNYNATECTFLQKQWGDPRVHFTSPSSIMSPIFLNQSCDPYTPEAQPCLIGNYVEYSINVTSAADVAAGVQFAQERNIRLVIKNTGHDYLGKSTGKGALSLWMHNLKSMDLVDYESKDYNGKAIKMGAGIQAFEALQFADSHGVRILASECTTVGLAGGYTQGGGRSTLSSQYGLAADNTLEWEVITADGQHMVASPTQNQDLYWALSGGGGGTYAVVLSLTTKAHLDGVVGGATLAFNTTTMPLDTYWDLVGIWQARLPALVDTGAMIVYQVNNTDFSISPLTSPGSTEAEVRELLGPFADELDNRKIDYTMSVTSFPTYLQHFTKYLGPLPDGIFPVAQLIGGRLVPRSVVQSNNAALTSAIRSIVSDGTFYIGGLAFNVSRTTIGNEAPSNSVLPAWRESILEVLIVSPWNFSAPFSSMLAVEDRMTNEIVPKIEKVTPGSGTYLNEGDFRLATWKEDFYGANYEKLRDIKKKYDRSDLFYATTAVGSDAWEVTPDGRLCRV